MRPTHHSKERVEEAAQVESLLKKENAATSRLNGEIAAANQRMIKEVAAMPLVVMYYAIILFALVG